MQSHAYGMTTNQNPLNTDNSWNRLEVKDPSQKILLADSIYYMSWSGVNTYVPCSYFELAYGTVPNYPGVRTVHLRHNAHGNATYFDGHVQASGSAELKRSGFAGGRRENFSVIQF